MVGIALWFWWRRRRADPFESRWLLAGGGGRGRAERRRARGRVDHHRGRSSAVDRLRGHARRGRGHREQRGSGSASPRSSSSTRRWVWRRRGAALDGAALARVRRHRPPDAVRSTGADRPGCATPAAPRSSRCRRESHDVVAVLMFVRRGRLRALRRCRLRQRRVGPARRWRRGRRRACGPRSTAASARCGRPTTCG